MTYNNNKISFQKNMIILKKYGIFGKRERLSIFIKIRDKYISYNIRNLWKFEENRKKRVKKFKKKRHYKTINKTLNKSLILRKM